jgi:hypothetical protein
MDYICNMTERFQLKKTLVVILKRLGAKTNFTIYYTITKLGVTCNCLRIIRHVFSEYGDEPSCSIKCWEVFEWLHNWGLLKKGSAP